MLKAFSIPANFWRFSCVACQSPLYFGAHGLCSRCRKQIISPAYCGRCGAPLNRSAMGCGNCLANPPIWDQMVVAGRYLPPLSELIQNFKLRRQFDLDGTLARLLYLALRQARREHQLLWPEALIPVPLHPKRQWLRGYNQAELLSAWLAKKLAIAHLPYVVKRIKNTPSQRNLNARERSQNLQNAFALPENYRFPYQHVALVDDVITTGATLEALSLVLKKAGVQRIQVWGIARA